MNLPCRRGLCFPVRDLDEKDLLVRELQQLKLAYQKLQDYAHTKDGEVSFSLSPSLWYILWTLSITLLSQFEENQNVSIFRLLTLWGLLDAARPCWSYIHNSTWLSVQIFGGCVFVRFLCEKGECISHFYVSHHSSNSLNLGMKRNYILSCMNARVEYCTFQWHYCGFAYHTAWSQKLFSLLF